MHIIATTVGFLFIIVILQDSFETIVLPRRVSRRFRLSRIFYVSSWLFWSALARKLKPGNRREMYLSYFGPLSLILLLILWATVLIIAFALMQWGWGSAFVAPERLVTLWTDLYMSGTTFITLGLGDITPMDGVARWFTVLEACTGFGFLALIIGYVPVIYQAFSRRELDIVLLDARAGTPPSASELLRRHFREQTADELLQFLRSWEIWSAQILESHLSYPVLTYYRSQHERQSWLAALTTVLDSCALLMVGLDKISAPTIRFTFAIARHAAVDLAQYFGTTPMNPKTNRLSSEDFVRLQASLAEVGLRFRQEETAEQHLAELRRMYEPFVYALADHLLVNMPPWVPLTRTVDDWQTSAWDHFAEWSPTRLVEITHIIVDHHKKVPLPQEPPHSHIHNEHEEHSSLERREKTS
jgi:Ion channel